MRKRVTRLCLTLAVILGSSVVRGGDLYVPSEYPSIQSAIDDAENGDVVIVYPNTYYENINFNGKAITVRSTDPNNPNIVSATIIDGSLPADPNYASVVTFNSGEGNDSVLEGFTITGGTGTWLVIAWDLHEPYWNRCGGGVVCYNMSQPTITKNVFTNNPAGEGGGVYVYGDPVNINDPSDPPIHITPVISDNTFINNFAIKEHGFSPPDSNYTFADHGDGGAIVAFQGVDPVIKNNLIQENHADYYGGGIHLRQWSNGFIEDNQIIANDSMLGAGIHITYSSDPVISNNLIKDNIAGNLGGGGIYIYYLSDPLIERNLITENESSNGAGIGIYYSSSPTIRNNLITNNVEGAGIIVKGGSTPTIIGNTIAGNEGSTAYGGGIECITDSAPVIENNIIVSEGSYGIYASVVPPVVKYNNVWGHSAGNYSPLIGDQTGVDGNISADPQFVATTGDYRLQLSSPCINAGDPNYLPEPGETDYYGNPRLLGECVDIGANETWPVRNITSGSQYDNIQQAINDANDCDVIILARGRHTGPGNRDIDFQGKPITLRSADPQDPEVVASTVIDSQGSIQYPHRGFYFHSGEDANSVIDGLTITGGSGAYQGGGINCIYNSSPTIKNCIITNNLTKDHGGGIYCGYESNPIITNCIINSNSFDRVGYGGGIFCYRSSPTITNCIITNNSAIGDSPPGHGRHGGGICCFGHQDGSSDPVIANCIISGNSAEHRGGGLYAYWSSPTAVNCTITGNRAYEGGGIGSFREANPTAINCIVRDNIAVFGNQLALINTLRLWPWEEITEMTISYSNIEGGLSDVCVDDNMILNWGQGNIDAEPNFVDPGYWDDAGTTTDPNDDFFVVGNYHLLPVSPCIDVGDNASIPTVSIVDIDDEPRIFNDIVDMGADEMVTNPADFDIDGIVAFNDLIVLAVEWLDSGSGLQSDLVDDDFIDLADYATFAEQWLHQAAWHE